MNTKIRLPRRLGAVALQRREVSGIIVNHGCIVLQQALKQFTVYLADVQPGKQGDILDIILVVVVEKRHLFVDTLIPQIRVFYDPVVCGVRKLHDSAEPHIHRPVQLVDQDLVLLLHRIRHLL